MRGEFIGVWTDTWQWIWSPLVDDDDVPDDIFCELYRTIGPALRDGISGDPFELQINDALQLTAAFERALVLSGQEINVLDANARLKASEAFEVTDLHRKRQIVQAVIEELTQAGNSVVLFNEGLKGLAEDAGCVREARQRAIDKVVNDRDLSKESFQRLSSNHFLGERALAAFFESAYSPLLEIGGDELANRYFGLLERFIEKFSLRYDLRRPCVLCPTLPGVFANLIRDLKRVTSQDQHLSELMRDFENAIRDLRSDSADGRIKTCIQKQINLLEALAAGCPGVTATELGAICNQLGSWPHGAVKSSLRNLYGFASDYPGIRHGGNAAAAFRAVDMRDMIAISVLLAGFTPYLAHTLNTEVVYGGG